MMLNDSNIPLRVKSVSPDESRYFNQIIVISMTVFIFYILTVIL